jgi:hypothetical protein
VIIYIYIYINNYFQESNHKKESLSSKFLFNYIFIRGLKNTKSRIQTKNIFFLVDF